MRAQNTAADLSGLSPEKREVVARLLAKRRTEPTTEQTIPRLENRQGLPLSFAQQRLWFLEQFEPGLVAYNMPYVLRLQGQLNVEALRLALETVVHRHEPLRTTFGVSDGQPIQAVQPPARFELPLFDFRNMQVREREAEVLRRAKELADAPFDLTADLMLRAALLREADDNHVLLLTMHHIASDGWSRRILIEEVSRLYSDFLRGERFALPDLPIQYADFSCWQRDRLQGEALERLLSYWKGQLSGAPPTLDLPTDCPRPDRQTYRGARKKVTLSQDLTASLRELGEQEKATAYMTILAAFNILLARWSGQRDIVVGSPVACRNRVEIEGLIGFFVNTLVLRSDLSGAPSFRELLGRVRETTIDAYAHQDLPFEKLVEELQPERSNRPPFFQALVNGINLGQADWSFPGIAAEQLELPEPSSKFDLTLYVRMQPDETALELVYNADIFSDRRMQCFLQQFHYLLEQVAARPDESIDSYSLITPESQSVLPDPWVAISRPQQDSVTSQVDAWTVRTPDQIAVSSGSSAWTYRELTSAAEKVRAKLNRAGIGSGDAVAVTGAASFGLVASILGILKCGAAIVPIDPELPAAGVRNLLGQADVPLLISVGNSALEEAKAPGRYRIVQVEAETGELASGEELEPEEFAARGRRQLPTGAAYIFFTSGTTGARKGVVGSHQSLSHFVNWQREQFDIGPGDRVAQVTSLSFDPVLREIFLPLTSGASLCLPECQIDDPTEFWRRLASHSVSILHCVPSRLQFWLGAVPDNVSLPSMRWLFSAGEPLADTLVKAWRSRFPGNIVNLYGPTETTMVKSWHQVPEPARPGVQFIGRPLPQTQMLVLHGDRLCGVGEFGEIVIRTPFCSLGYLDDAQNEGRFVRNPFRDDDDVLLYRTGDSGRYLADGQLEIGGRLDDQVKIRGVRVEPAEVAATLNAHEGVHACHVGSIADQTGQAQLVAWVVPARGRAATIQDLRIYLMSLLPTAFVPAYFVVLDALPLTANGKVNRKALPNPGPDTPTTDRAPRNLLEEQLAAIWRDTLGVDHIGIHDDFFSLGGHSMLATQVAARARRTFEVEVPIRLLFEQPTVAQLGKFVETQRRNRAGLELPVLQPVPRNKPLPLSYCQERMWQYDSTAYNQTRCLELQGPLDVRALQQALTEITRRHEALRTTYELRDGRPLQIVARPDPVSMPVVDLTRCADPRDEADQMRRAERNLPFDLSRDHPLRAQLLMLGGDLHWLVLTLHHIVTDRASSRMLRNELSVLYAAYRQNKPSPLKEPSLQLGDFAAWERELLDPAGTLYGKQLAYWMSHLNGDWHFKVPLPPPESSIQDIEKCRQDLDIEPHVATKLKAIGRAANCTLFMTMLAGLKALLFQRGGYDDFLIGTYFGGRIPVELEEVFGCFAKLVALRTSLTGNPSFLELLGRVRETTLGAYTHHELPFELLVDEFQRVGRKPPAVSLIFSSMNSTPNELRLKGLQVKRVNAARTAEMPWGMTVGFSDGAKTLSVGTAFDCTLYDPEAVCEMLADYTNLLQQVARNPELRLMDLRSGRQRAA